MATVEDAIEIARQADFLAVISTLREDGTIQSSVVNAGAMKHPVTRDDVIAFVTYGKAKMANLRVRPQLSVTFRAGWQWVCVEGRAELVGPNDPHPDLEGDALRLLLREIFVAAGGHHDDWDEYDRTMAKQGRTAVLITPSRIYGN